MLFNLASNEVICANSRFVSPSSETVLSANCIVGLAPEPPRSLITCPSICIRPVGCCKSLAAVVTGTWRLVQAHYFSASPASCGVYRIVHQSPFVRRAGQSNLSCWPPDAPLQLASGYQHTHCQLLLRSPSSCTFFERSLNDFRRIPRPFMNLLTRSLTPTALPILSTRPPFSNGLSPG